MGDTRRRFEFRRLPVDVGVPFYPAHGRRQRTDAGEHAALPFFHASILSRRSRIFFNSGFSGAGAGASVVAFRVTAALTADGAGFGVGWSLADGIIFGRCRIIFSTLFVVSNHLHFAPVFSATRIVSYERR
jgi:hypothetical protein